jgi:hypothetical protein
MANTLPVISYANTFGDWVVVTDNLVNEVNTLGKGNYTKDAGLLTLAGSGTGLQVANNSVFQGNVLITGSGTALQVAHDAIISGNLTVVGNTTIQGFEIEFQDIQTNTIHANTATLNQTLYVGQSADIGQSLAVGTDATISGNLTVLGTTNISLDEIVAGNVTSNAVYSNTATVTGTLTAGSLQGQANDTIVQIISDSANNSVGTALAFSIALG